MKVIFLGPPNVGKGSYARRLSERLGIAHISTGDMFRQMAEDGHPLGIEAKEKFWGNGDLVPDEITTKLLLERLKKSDCEKGFILDGFPRTIPQAEALESVGIDLVISLHAPEEVIIERVQNRIICKNKKCNIIYNKKTIIPKKEGICDRCGSELYQREDDKNPEIIRNRLKVYWKQTAPLIEYYKNKGSFRELDSVRDVEVVTQELFEILTSINK